MASGSVPLTGFSVLAELVKDSETHVFQHAHDLFVMSFMGHAILVCFIKRSIISGKLAYDTGNIDASFCSIRDNSFI